MAAVTRHEGPVAVTGASGFIGAHVVSALMKRGYELRACVTDLENEEKTRVLEAINKDSPGRLTLHEANLLESGSYDAVFAGCSAVMHLGTPMAYGAKITPTQVYEGSITGTRNVLESVARAGSVARVIYTSSFAAVAHPARPGYVFTEADWATDNRAEDPNWNMDDIDNKGDTGYAMAKVECEEFACEFAETDGRFDVVSICPSAVLGPLLSPLHELVGSWQYYLGRMLEGEPCGRSWKSLWNCVDVRDVAEAQALALESRVCRNRSRYLLTATDRSYELSAAELQAHLQALFPHIEVGGPSPAYDEMIQRDGAPFDGPRAYCDKARGELGLTTHALADTLRSTGETLIALGLVTPKRRS